MELSEKDKKAAVLILHECLNVMDECFGRGENPLSRDTAFTVHDRLKKMAAGPKSPIDNSKGSYQFLAHVFTSMADRKKGAKGQRATRCNRGIGKA